MKNDTFLKRAEIMYLLELSKLGLIDELKIKVQDIILKASQQNRAGYITTYSKLLIFLDSLETEHIKLCNQIFTKGNSKLPFISFSNAPIVNCPGAGDCINLCYSLKSLRYPGVQTRFIQNTILLEKNYSWIVEQDFKRLVKTGKIKFFRLYVDGDFKSKKEVIFWMDLLKKFPGVKAYGYTKSTSFFNDLNNENYNFPNNYKLNISSGSNNPKEALKLANSKLNIVRGNFINIDINSNSSSNNRTLTDKQLIKEKLGTNRDYKLKNGRSYFVCSGLCGTCTKKGHACGLDSFKNIDIIIPNH